MPKPVICQMLRPPSTLALREEDRSLSTPSTCARTTGIPMSCLLLKGDAQPPLVFRWVPRGATALTCAITTARPSSTRTGLQTKRKKPSSSLHRCLLPQGGQSLRPLQGLTKRRGLPQSPKLHDPNLPKPSLGGGRLDLPHQRLHNPSSSPMPSS